MSTNIAGKTAPDTIAIDNYFEAILMCAVRYACGRHTYMPGLVQDWIIGHCTGKLSENCLTIMLRDIQEQTAMSDWIEGCRSTSLFEHDLMLKLANWCGEELKKYKAHDVKAGTLYAIPKGQVKTSAELREAVPWASD